MWFVGESLYVTHISRWAVKQMMRAKKPVQQNKRFVTMLRPQLDDPDEGHKPQWNKVDLVLLKFHLFRLSRIWEAGELEGFQRSSGIYCFALWCCVIWEAWNGALLQKAETLNGVYAVFKKAELFRMSKLEDSSVDESNGGSNTFSPSIKHQDVRIVALRRCFWKNDCTLWF